MLGVVVLVLLVACVNIANLLDHPRGARAAHEMSVQARARQHRGGSLARQLLAESLLLAGLGAAVGLVFAAWASRIVVAGLSTPDTQVALDLSLDWRVLAVTAFTGVLTALLFGIGPALRASRAAPIDALRRAGQGAASARAFRGPRGAPGRVVAGAARRRRIVRRDLQAAGNAAARVRRPTASWSSMSIPRAPTRTRRRVFGYYQQLVDTSAAVPGVASAAASTITPFNAATKSPLFADPDSGARAGRLAGVLCHLRP